MELQVCELLWKSQAQKISANFGGFLPIKHTEGNVVVYKYQAWLHIYTTYVTAI